MEPSIANDSARIVFADEAKRQHLNHILHPFIIARQDEILREWEAKIRMVSGSSTRR